MGSRFLSIRVPMYNDSLDREIFVVCDCSSDESVEVVENFTEASLDHHSVEIEEGSSFNRSSMPGWRIMGQVLRARAVSCLALGVFDGFAWLWRKIDGSLQWQPVSIIAIARRKC